MLAQDTGEVVRDHRGDEEEAVVVAGELGDESFDRRQVAIQAPECVPAMPDAGITRAEHPQRVPVGSYRRFEVCDQRGPFAGLTEPACGLDNGINARLVSGTRMQGRIVALFPEDLRRPSRDDDRQRVRNGGDQLVQSVFSSGRLLE